VLERLGAAVMIFVDTDWAPFPRSWSSVMVRFGNLITVIWGATEWDILCIRLLTKSGGVLRGFSMREIMLFIGKPRGRSMMISNMAFL